MTGDDDYSSLEVLAGYECPECGRMDEMEYTEDEASTILGGDEHGFTRCPECGAELEPTVEAAADHLAWLSERLSKIEGAS